jgi:transporter family-2 protein
MRTQSIGVIVLTALVGALLPLQAGINTRLRILTGDTVDTVFVSLSVGLLFTTLCGPSFRWHGTPATQPWWIWCGGVVGAIYLLTTIAVARHLGAAVMIGALVCGQAAGALLLDSLGAAGYARQPLTIGRVVGTLLIVVGVMMARRTSSQP